MTYVSRVLFASGIGEVASATNVAGYFVVLAALGMPTYGTKSIAACTDKRSVNKIFWDLFTINAISTAVFSFSYYLLIFTHPFFQEQLPLFCVVGLGIVFNIFNVDWFYRGKEEFGYITLRSFIIKVLSLVAIFIFIKSEEDVIVYALVITLSNVANYVFNIIHLRKYISLPRERIAVSTHLKPILLLLSASIIIELYTMVGTTLLTVFSTSECVGYFTNSMSIIRVIRSIVTSISAVFLPRLSFYYSSGRQQEFERLINNGLKILLFLTIPAAVGIFSIAEDAVLILFGSSFYGSIISVRILSLSIITIALSNFIGYQVFITVGKEKLMVLSTVVGASTNLILNFILIFYLDYVGVALASALAELAVTVYQMYYLYKLSLLKINMRYLTSVILASVAMVLAVLLISQLLSNQLIRLITSVVMGAVCYMFLSVSFKNEFAIQLLDRFMPLYKRYKND